MISWRLYFGAAGAPPHPHPREIMSPPTIIDPKKVPLHLIQRDPMKHHNKFEVR